MDKIDELDALEEEIEREWAAMDEPEDDPKYRLDVDRWARRFFVGFIILGALYVWKGPLIDGVSLYDSREECLEYADHPGQC